MIPVEKCKDGWLYLINARNSCLGIFNEKEKGFIIRRIKFNAVFLFIEYHWDTGEPYGTAKALKELYQVPENIRSKPEPELLDYLKETKNKYQKDIQRLLKRETKR